MTISDRSVLRGAAVPPTGVKKIPTSMVFPMTEVVCLPQDGVRDLQRDAGLALMNMVMKDEVWHLTGERHQQHWGGDQGYCVVDGKNAPIRNIRPRNAENQSFRTRT